MSSAVVELEHVYVARGENIVLHDVSLRIDAGEHVVILGPNGCGKSTLLKALTCEIYPLVRPETRVSIFGRDRWDLTELRRKMGVVSAELPGQPMLRTRGYDAVLTGFFSSSTLWPNLHVTSSMHDRAEQLLKLMNAEALCDKPFSEMSAGQQRRLMIARAMAGASPDGTGDVQMLLLDEPSNALDLAAQRGLRESLRTVAQNGTGILLITHHVADILPEMDRIIMLREGRVVADGSKRDLLTGPRLTELFGSDLRVTEIDGYWHAF